MRKSFWFHLCSVLTLAAANFLFCAVSYSQLQNPTAYVTSAQLQGNPTGGAPASLTVSIFRSSNLNTYDIVGVCSPPLSDINKIVCGSGGLDFPPGVNTLTVSVDVEATTSVETTSLVVATSYAIDQFNDQVYFNDPGITVPVTITPDTISITVNPSVVSPSGSSPELAVSVKNGNGTLMRYNTDPGFTATWDCSTATFTSWDFTSNPNVSAQTALPIIQAPFTQVCNVQVPLTSWDGRIVATATVTYQESPNNADLGPSCPRSGSEGTCGSPITLTNGNTWTQADDYELPGLGGGLSLKRTWNSQWSSYQGWILAGMFGDSWQSNYEKHIQALSSSQLLDWRGDGSSWFFTSPSKGTWALSTPADERATLTFSNKAGYTITLRDGSVELYDTNGNLTALQDRNGNKATLTYDTTSFHRVTKVTDAAGRVLTFTYGSSTLPKQEPASKIPLAQSRRMPTIPAPI